MKTNVLLIFLFLLTGSSCTDKQDLKILEGNYQGSYYTLNHYTGRIMKTDSVNVVLEGKNFSSSPSPDRMPAGGSGTYEFTENNLINFKDSNAWTANFDWNLILNGKFSYEIKGDSLILTRYFEPCPNCNYISGNYQYRLKRLTN